MVVQLLLFLWELPQNLAGMMYYLFIRRSIALKEPHQRHLFCHAGPYSVSLGRFIFWSDHVHPDPGFTVKAHEYGHAVQSLILGPLYLLIVGIPSAARYFYSAWYRKKKRQDWKGYFSGFPENWADALGRKYFRNH